MMKRTFLKLVLIEAFLVMVVIGLVLYATSRSSVLGAKSPHPEVTWCIEQQCFKPTPILPNETAFTTFLRLAQFENITYSTITDKSQKLISVSNRRVSPNSAWSLSVASETNQGIERDLYTYIPQSGEELTLSFQNEVSN